MSQVSKLETKIVAREKEKRKEGVGRKIKWSMAWECVWCVFWVLREEKTARKMECAEVYMSYVNDVFIEVWKM